MANDNTLLIIGLIFFMVMLIFSLVMLFPTEDKNTLSISNVKEEKTDLFTLPRQTIDTSICYDIMSCTNVLAKEGTRLDDLETMGLELNCEQIPCYFQGVNSHA